MTRQKLFGVLSIDKPAGLTSRAVVDRVVRAVWPERTGHAGTLDPLATGVLVVCLGRATRLIRFIQEQPKEYRARFLLGRRSNTDDVTGEVVNLPVTQHVTRQQIEDLLPDFVGEIEQVPPQFSAVHVDGERAYKRARRGERFDLKPRRVTIDRIELVDFSHPELELKIECGSGTYIRSIGRDFGERLGCGAVLSELERTRVGPFHLADAIALDQLEAASVGEFLLPATLAVEHLPRHLCQPAELHDIRCGRSIQCLTNASLEEGALVAVVTAEEHLACLANYQSQDRTLAPKQVFLD